MLSLGSDLFLSAHPAQAVWALFLVGKGIGIFGKRMKKWRNRLFKALEIFIKWRLAPDVPCSNRPIH